jgi:ParB family chromosome partitioning protein
MSKQTIGRSLGRINLDENEFELPMPNGDTKVFTKKIIPFNEIETKTLVEIESNGRNQIRLSEDNLNDIVRTISIRQFYPAFGYYNSQKKIVIVDGSRRRKSCILAKANFEVLVCSELNREDAIWLSKQLQTAKELDFYEKSCLLEQKAKLMGYFQGDVDLDAISTEVGLSKAQVSKSLKVAKISADLFAVLPKLVTPTMSQYYQLAVLDEKFLSAELDIKQQISVFGDFGDDINDILANLKLLVHGLDKNFNNHQEQIERIFNYQSLTPVEVKKIQNLISKAHKFKIDIDTLFEIDVDKSLSNSKIIQLLNSRLVKLNSNQFPLEDPKKKIIKQEGSKGAVYDFRNFDKATLNKLDTMIKKFIKENDL